MTEDSAFAHVARTTSLVGNVSRSQARDREDLWSGRRDLNPRPQRPERARS